MLDKIKKLFQDNPVLYVFGGFVILAVIIVTLTLFFYAPKDNYDLSKEDKELQKEIQKDTDRKDILLEKVLITSGNWKLVNVNLADNRDNYALVITQNDEVVFGPGTYFDLAELVNGGVPDDIVSYLHPGIQWVNFGENFDGYFPYSESMVKYVIQYFAQENGIEVKRVIMLDDGRIDYSVENAYEFNRTETRAFRFTLNNNTETIYTFRSYYTGENYQTTYSILDAAGSVLYSQIIQ